MPKVQKKPAKFKFSPFSTQQQKLMHWWRPPLVSSAMRFCGGGRSHPIRKDYSLHYWLPHLVAGDVRRSVFYSGRKDNGSAQKECNSTYATDS